MYPKRLNKFDLLRKIAKKLKIDGILFLIYVYIVERMFPSKLMREEKIYYEANRDKIKFILNKLDDEKSINSYKACLNFRMNRSANLFKHRKKIEEQYFSPDIVNVDNECFVDCGAYNGDTLKQFRKMCNDHFEKYYALEPDVRNAEELENYVKENNLSKVEILKYGVADLDGQLCFSGGHDTISVIDKNGKDIIEVRKLDTLLKDKKVTFIKMDIEGAEMSALNGAWNLIEKFRPKLAICIYHSKEDMVNIPYVLINRLLNYKFYIRHYTSVETETILYCIPQK